MSFTRTTTMNSAAALFAAAGLSLAAGGTTASADEDAGRIEIGYLECDLTANEGNIIVSEQQYICTFDPAEDGLPVEMYVADISKFGIDLSKTDEETIRWGVLAPAEKFATGVLAGEYAGISADAAIGVGVGAKALVGGLEESIALQPLSVTTQEGFGLALGIESLKLSFIETRS